MRVNTMWIMHMNLTSKNCCKKTTRFLSFGRYKRSASHPVSNSMEITNREEETQSDVKSSLNGTDERNLRCQICFNSRYSFIHWPMSIR